MNEYSDRWNKPLMNPGFTIDFENCSHRWIIVDAIYSMCYNCGDIK